MHSRVILLGGIVALSCLILASLAAMQIVVGEPSRADASSPAEIDAVTSAGPRAYDEAIGRRSARGGDEPLAGGKAAGRTSEARQLERLLRQADASLAGDGYVDAHAEGVPLSEAVVSFFGKMVRIINEDTRNRFEIEVGHPDLDAARFKAELLRSSLALALNDPSRLHIEETTSPEPRISVRAFEIAHIPNNTAAP